MLKTVNKKNEISTRLTKASKVYQKASNLLIKGIPFLPSYEKYNLTICSEKKFIWFRVAKVGTRTILDALIQSSIYLDAEHPYNCYYPRSNYKDYFKFAFIRNPYDRLVSCWFNKVVDSNYFKFSNETLLEMQNFKNFVHFVENQNIEKCDHHIRLQSKLIDLNEIDYIGRFESFQKDLSHVLKSISIENQTISKINSTNNRLHYKEYYDEDLITRVAKIYEKDLNLFSYEF